MRPEDEVPVTSLGLGLVPHIWQTAAAELLSLFVGERTFALFQVDRIDVIVVA